MGNFCACIITTSPLIMPPKRVLPIHTKRITQPLHTVHTSHVSASFSVSIHCVCAGLTSHRAHRAVNTLSGEPCKEGGDHVNAVETHLNAVGIPTGTQLGTLWSPHLSLLCPYTEKKITDELCGPPTKYGIPLQPLTKPRITPYQSCHPCH